MNLTIADIAELPLAAALLDSNGDVVARTPEWDGPGPGAVAYPVRNMRLVVRTRPASPLCDAVLSRLLDSIDDSVAGLDVVHAQRVRILACSLRLVAGREAGGWGSTDEVLDLARAAITARTGLAVDIVTGAVRPVLAPEVAALVLVQLAVNAERHDAAERVRLEVDKTTFRVVWRRAGDDAPVKTARRHGERTRWGLGFARVAADAIGGTVYPPRAQNGGEVAAILEMGVRRLALPLATVRGGQVCRATRSWDEETSLGPGAVAHRTTRLGVLCAAAEEDPGRIVGDDWTARAGAMETWVAVPPDDSDVRARDVVAGLIHERALADRLDEPARSTIAALALLLATLLGEPMPRVPIGTWTRRMTELGPAFGITVPIPRFDGVGAIDPRVVALLTGSAHGFDVDGDRLWLRIRDECRDDAAVKVLLRPGEDRIPIG